MERCEDGLSALGEWSAWLTTDAAACAAWSTVQGFLQEETACGATVYPPAAHRLRALQSTPPAQVRVVVLGQDPYHNPGQADGLCFSVPPGQRPPPSLRNILTELRRDLALPASSSASSNTSLSSDLSVWARQGVLLLNTVLSVRAGEAGSHRGRGWETITDTLITHLARQRENLVFLLWGRDAQSKLRLIDPTRHCVLTSPHPSPLSAHRGFLGNGHFSAANRYLSGRGIAPVNWQEVLGASLPS